MDDNSFNRLGLCDRLVKACSNLGWTSPSAFQREVIPHALAGRDLIGIAPPCSDTIAAFALPILQALLDAPQPFLACVISPTRELAIQIGEQFQALGRVIGLKVNCAVLVPGRPLALALDLAQMPHIVVATPIRLSSQFTSYLSTLEYFSTLKYLVLNDADMLVDPEFQFDIKMILCGIARERKTYLFSATMNKKIKKLERACLHDPVKVGGPFKN